MSVCAASKAQTEQAMWHFTKEHEPQFVANSVLHVFALWHKNYFFEVLYPQFVIDIKDTACSHAHNKIWTDWIARLKMYPDHNFPDPPENEGGDMANVTGRPKAERLLKWLGKDGLRPMEEFMKEVCDTFA
ncbi:hypothetical protein B0A55_10505 [Friedmanniomyces simplex]|uniref:Uncharacterized protein n=1 Tax=Friedmanniomyces simplex TaxID=329884 RepID=A0A4U0WHJ3_9PEZI|nr:hypothetical protein B0A55_10505 [Friedmanniomyces simplex]